MEYRILEEKRDFEQAIDLEIAVWGLDPRDATPANLMVALHHAGGVTIGAYDRKQIVGVSFAFPFLKEDRAILWSHSTGVHQDYQGQGIGYQLKLYQREWALANGYDEIGWTFDPLQRGNANFNLHQLGAFVQSYQVNFYGVMQDEINHGDLPSDRLEAVWRLNEAPLHEIYPEFRTIPYLLRDAGAPEASSIDRAQPAYLIQIPRNLAALPNMDALLAWRMAVRWAFTQAFDCGYVAVDFIETNAYLVRRS